MFTARFTVFALLTFLAGANAGCATCEDTIEVNGDVTYELVSDSMNYDNGYTLCKYVAITRLLRVKWLMSCQIRRHVGRHSDLRVYSKCSLNVVQLTDLV
jgi:hypothetical protein